MMPEETQLGWNRILSVRRRKSGRITPGRSPGSELGRGSCPPLAFPGQDYRVAPNEAVITPYSGGTAPALNRTSLLHPCGYLRNLKGYHHRQFPVNLLLSV